MDSHDQLSNSSLKRLYRVLFLDAKLMCWDFIVGQPRPEMTSEEFNNNI